jgi:hypothetical protein
MFKAITIGALVVMLAFAPAARAGLQGGQKRNDKPKRGKAEKPKADKSKAEGVFVGGQAPTSNQTINGSAYLQGEVKVIVKGEQNPVVRIGMAQAGVTLVEFPDGDKFFAIHPPENGDLVRVEKSPSIKADHHLVLRAGRDLANAPGPAASITVQMRSGLNVILWIYPVKFVTQQTHRCVFSYDRTQIVAARKAAGLAVNLGEERETEAPPAGTVAVTIVPATAQRPEPQPAPHAPPPAAPVTAPAEDNEEQKEKVDAGKTGEALRKALKDAMGDPKSFKHWSHETHGLSVSTKARELDEQTRIALVAVKNVGDVPLQILPGHPELVIETVNEKDKIIQLENVKKRLQEASTTSNVIPARTTVYYAVAFAPPILGKRQKLRVTVGQRNAADDPAGVNLTARAKK